MKKIITLLCVFIFCKSFSQDSSLSYVKIIQIDSLTKDQIYDRSLLWCSKSFNNSKYATNVQERNGGMIAGKAYYDNFYKIPSKKDSIMMIAEFNHYYFDWLIEIKDNKVRFTLSNIEIEQDQSTNKFDVTSSEISPYQFLFQSKQKTNLYWMLSKKYFVVNMDNLMASLDRELNEKKSDW